MKRKIIIVVVLSCLLIGSAVCLILYNRETFTGSRTANPDSYRLTIVRMNGTDRHTMELRAGDRLGIQFRTERGALNLEIKAPDGVVLYSGNGTDVTGFSLNVTQSGAYTVTVRARHAKGTIRLEREESGQ